MIRLYRCLICGNVHGGPGELGRCPFCGSPGRFLVEPSEWRDENVTLPDSLSPASRDRLACALQGEVSDSNFYYRAYRATSHSEVAGLFRYLWRVEREHQPVIHRMLKGRMPHPDMERAQPPEGDLETIELARRRELDTVAFYREIAAEAAEWRVRRVFEALSEVETDHAAYETLLKQGLEP